MVRKVVPLQSQSCNTATNSVLPVGSRLWYVQGEADSKPTYDFQVLHAGWQDGGALTTVSIKYCGVRNGQKVMLHGDWPHVTTTISTPNAVGDQQIVITSGTGVNLQIYYITGALAAG